MSLKPRCCVPTWDLQTTALKLLTAFSLDHLVVPKMAVNTTVASGTANQFTIVNFLLIVTMLESYNSYF